MPPTLNYPGVYIEEISSGVHTITGVATSVAAFVGWTRQGPTDEAVLVESWSEFQAQFGGLSSTNGLPDYLGYSVYQFFGNGGQQAYIVRVVWDGTLAAAVGPLDPAGVASATGIGGTLNLSARNPGEWGKNIRVNVILFGTRFTLQILYAPAGQPPQVVENFVNLSVTANDPRYVVTVINSDSQYVTFGDPTSAAFVAPAGTPTATAAPVQLSGALATSLDGSALVPGDGNFEVALGADASPISANHYGLRLLDRVDIFNLLCVPGETDGPTISTLQGYCALMRAFYIVDSFQTATTAGLNTSGPVGSTAGSITGTHSNYSAYYYPWVQAPDPLAGNRPTLFPPCGFVAGIYAATDTARGVWKAPAGIDASLTGVTGLQYKLTDQENGNLNIQAINCLREFKIYGDVVWGARTLQGNNQAGSEWKYVPIRRLALFLESSLYDGTQWVVFEPNAEPLWSQIRLNVGAFMQGLFLQGAFQGTTPQKAYFVKCDAENNPQASINQGIVNILVGFAPLYPAEFVVIQIQQMAGQLQA